MHYCFINSGTWEFNPCVVRLRALGTELIRHGVKVTYVVDDLPFNRTQLNLHPDAQVRFVSDPQSLKQLRNRRRILNEVKPDYVHLLTPAVKTFLAVAGSRWKVVGDFDEWTPESKYGLVRRTKENALNHWMQRRASVSLVCSHRLQNFFRERFHQETTYVPYAAYLTDYPDETSPFPEPTAVYMGNFYSAWDHDLIFEAAVRLKQRGQMPRITFLGMGPDLEKWQAFIRENELTNLSIAGFLSGAELWRHLRHAHVLLFPIRATPLNQARCPSKTFAYAQARRPVITNRVGEVAYILGDAATYIECTADAFADAISEAMAAQTLEDVDYGIEEHNWAARAASLLRALGLSVAPPEPECRIGMPAK